LPYIMPVAVPAEVGRFVPQVPGEWAAKLTHERAGQPDVLMIRRTPVISDDRIIQVAAIGEEATATTVNLIVWSTDHVPDANRYRITAECGDQRPVATVVKAEAVDVPSPVRSELIYAGYAKPPVRVVWLTLELKPPVGAKRPLILRVQYDGATKSTIVVPFDPTS
jgi:hypothetical protein